MPKTKSAKKALRVARKKRVENLRMKEKFKLIFKQLDRAEESKKAELLSKAFSTLDKAVKKRIIHPNKAARLKSRFCPKFKLITPQKIKDRQAPKEKKTPAKKEAKSKK